MLPQLQPSAKCLSTVIIGQRVLDLHDAGLGDVRGNFRIRMNARNSNGLCSAMLLRHGLRYSGDDKRSQSKLSTNTVMSVRWLANGDNKQRASMYFLKTQPLCAAQSGGGVGTFRPCTGRDEAMLI